MTAFASTPQDQFAGSPYCSLCISYCTYKENLLNKSRNRYNNNNNNNNDDDDTINDNNDDDNYLAADNP